MGLTNLLGFAWLLFDRFVNNFLILLRLKYIATNMHYVNIKFGTTNHCLPLQIKEELTVGQVKKQLVEAIGKEVGDIKEIAIIFAGKEISDDLKISDCDLGENTILHAVRISTKRKTQPKTSGLLTDSLANLTNIQSNQHVETPTCSHHQLINTNTKSYFFVYCSSSYCKKVTSGKLRVVCNKCKKGTLIVKKDPREWDDVLVVGRIPGVCQIENCDGDTALFYFKCTSNQHNDSFDDNSAVVLYLIRRNLIQVPCLACTEIKDVVLVFPCLAGHVICLDCFKNYCTSRLNERSFVIDPDVGYSLACPVGCSQSLIKETHHFRILDDDLYQKYQSFATEEYLLKAGGVLCPRPNCGEGIFIDPSDASCTKITCVSCGFVFCRKCLQGYHLGDCSDDISLKDQTFSRELLSNNADESKWSDKLSFSAIKQLTKPCPKCRTPTERDGGCMHMVCMRPQCGFSWCWVCQTQWSRECMGNHWFG